MLKLRPHHLVCLRLFQGLGYDGTFTAKMQEICDFMNSGGDGRFTLVSGADDICAACPNHTPDSTCALGEADAWLRDARALDALGLRAGSAYSFAEVDRLFKKNMTEEAFEAVCGGCRWKEAGVCTYSGLSPGPSPMIVGGES